MALSDYERRVLNELEFELAAVDSGRWALSRRVARRLRPVLIGAAWLAGCILLEVLASPGAALVCGMCGAFWVGVWYGRTWGRPRVHATRLLPWRRR